MDQSTTLRIAQRFSRLSPEQRRLAYQKIRLEGLDIGQFPILARDDATRAAETASYAQARQWFLWQMDPASTSYHLSGALRLVGALDVPALKASFDALVQRHESLRTVFRAVDRGRVEQRVLDSGGLRVEEVELGMAEPDELALRLQAEAARLCRAPFDLEQGPLLRVGLIREAPGRHVLVVAMHHIVCDGWSLQLIVDEFVAQYVSRIQGREPGDERPLIQYADYAQWQRHWLEAGEAERQLAYWRAQLGDTHPVLQLPADHPRSTDGRYAAARHQLELPAALAEKLRRRALAEDGTLFMLLLAGVQALLYRHGGQSDVRVGVPVANRHRVETEGVVGLFVNTQVLRNVMHGRLPLARVLQQAKEAALGAQAHQDLPFEKLVEALQPERTLGVHPLFQVVFNHQRLDDRSLRQLPGLRLEEVGLAGQAAQFELAVDSSEAADGCVRLSFTYARELFEPATIARMAGHFVTLLQALAESPWRALDDVPLLDETEQTQLRLWGEKAPRVGSVAPVHRLFEQHARDQHQATALLFADEVLGYGDLNARANGLAHRLIAQGVRPETRVGILAERSVEMVVGMLAILKAGGAYVPLDPEYPAERLAYMVRDSGVGLVLAQGALRNRLPAVAGLEVLEFDTLELAAEPTHDPQVAVHQENLAYVIYTSGSTGLPKGAAVRHGSLSRCMAWMQRRYGLTASDTVLHKAPFGFDVSAWEIFWPLTVGVRLVIANPGDHRDPARIISLILRHQVTTVNFVPAMLQAFLAQEGIERQTRLRYVICGGEAMPAATQGDALRRLRGVSLQNLYGPTETTIHVTQWTCRDDGQSLVPIGQPIDETTAYVLDESLGLVPRGVVGELFIGGMLLGRGYLGRAGLTSERFVADPYGVPGGRLYRTGDLVRWNAEGQLEYLGRADHQVKIRGLRIELGEVEAQLRSQPEVGAAVVVAQEGLAGARLVGYVSAQAGQVAQAGELRARLGRVLPDYMVPAAIVVLERLPLNANGKVDRKMLPESAIEGARAYEAPQGEAESAMARIWADVLGVERVGRHDNFFELGGHSLAALHLVRAAADLPGGRILLKDVFATSSLAELAGRAASAQTALPFLNAAKKATSTLFVLHDGWGSTLDYTALALALEPGGCSVIGIPYSPDEMEGPADLAQLAQQHAAAIIASGRTGPFQLAGWSLGGALAPLVAQALERGGHRVDFVGAIDPFVPPMQGNEASIRFDDEIREFLAILLPRGQHGRLQQEPVLQGLLARAEEEPDGLVPLLNALLARVSPEDLHEYGALGAQELARMFVGARRLRAAGNRPHAPVELAARVTAWWSQNRPSEEKEAYSAWVKCRQPMAQNVVEADHLQLVRSSMLFEQLRQALLWLK